MENYSEETQVLWLKNENKKIYFELAAIYITFMEVYFNLINRYIEDVYYALGGFFSGVQLLFLAMVSGGFIAYWLMKLPLIILGRPKQLSNGMVAYLAKTSLSAKKGEDGYLCFSDAKICWGFMEKQTKKITFKETWLLDEIDGANIVKKDLFHSALRVKFRDGTSRIFRILNSSKLPDFTN